jgi:hypothetical protein
MCEALRRLLFDILQWERKREEWPDNARDELAAKGRIRRRLPDRPRFGGQEEHKERGFLTFVLPGVLLWQWRFGGSTAFAEAASGIGPRRLD